MQMILLTRPVGVTTVLRLIGLLVRPSSPVMWTVVVDVAVSLTFLCVTALPLLATALT